MTNMSTLRSGAILAGLLLLCSIGALANAQAPAPAAPTTGPTAAPEDVQTLRERTAAFWTARLANDVNGQWVLLEPRIKGRLPVGEYTPNTGAVRYVAFQVEDATVTGYFATVKVRVMFQPILPTARRIGVTSTVVEDRWVRIGGVWYRRLDDESLGG